MDCSTAKQELPVYLYGDIEESQQKLLQDHLDQCPTCTHELEEMLQVQRFIDVSSPGVWHRTWFSSRSLHKLSWAAILLLGISIGWGGYWLMLRQVPTIVESKKPPSRDILELLAQNQRYRSSLSKAQLLLVQKMEKYLVTSSTIAEQVADIHQIELANRSRLYAQAVVQQRSFLHNYPDSPLAIAVRTRLAQNLSEQGKYLEAVVVYEQLLEQADLTPHERGKYLWQLAECYKSANRDGKYRNLLEELEADHIYGFQHWRAIKALAEDDFHNMRFLAARERYRRYAHRDGESAEQVSKYIMWIDAHEQYNFYPLQLFVEAQQKGREAHYGLRIIMAEYPHSPLAFRAFALYLQNQSIPFQEAPLPFPRQQTPQQLLPYLAKVSQIQELEEIAVFAKYWQAHLLEQAGDILPAIKIYEEVAASRHYAIGELAKKRLSYLQNTQTRRKNT